MTSHPTAVRAAATTCLVLAALVAGAVTPGVAGAARFSVDLWTGRGNEAVYRPGEGIDIGFNVSEDAHLLVYEIDSEGYVHVLFPQRRGDDLVPGGRDLSLPEDDDAQLVVQGPVGEGYIVAIASVEPFEPLPWYLRPRDTQADELGYYGEPEDLEDENVTAEGRIVGDPFVAMERIRRKVLANPQERDGFATDYTTYYVHNAVRYPRYLCYDCHRPNRWAWWDGFDPYYTRCSVVDFRVNVSWGWGPTYWFGYIPYYTYVYRHDCPPRYFPPGVGPGGWCGTSWEGWGRWRQLWGGALRRYKSPPPVGYISPRQYDEGQRWKTSGGAQKPLPPGFLATAHGSPQTGVRRSVGRGATSGGTDRSPKWTEGRTPRGERTSDGTRLGNPRGETPWGRSSRGSKDDTGGEAGRSDRSPRPPEYVNPGTRAPRAEPKPSQGPTPWIEKGERSGRDEPATRRSEPAPRRDEPAPRREEPAPRQSDSGRERAPAPDYQAPRNPDPPRNSEAPKATEAPRPPRNDPPPRVEAPRSERKR